MATALDLAAEVTAGEENEDPGNDESWLAQATTVRDFVFQDLPSTLVEVVAKARGGNSKHMWPPETAIESCSNTCRKKVRSLNLLNALKKPLISGNFLCVFKNSNSFGGI